MQESILHFIWQHQYFKIGDAYTSRHEKVTVSKQGIYNTNAGPDFEQAKIVIGNVEWSGAVEIHIKSSNWDVHKHQNDRAYNNVILHVVWEKNKEIRREDGTLIPTLELRNLVDHGLITKAELMINNLEPIPCATQIKAVSNLIIIDTIQKSLVKRLERKSEIVLQELNLAKGDWPETVYRLLMRQMGMKVNGEVFYQLATAIPYQLIRKYKHSITSIEALLFGASGLLLSLRGDEYTNELKKEYDFFKHKHKLLKQLEPQNWKFMRLRPSNFPTLRIAQAAAMLAKSSNIFESFTEFSDTKDLTNRLRIATSSYWKNHYRFGTETKTKVPDLGKTSVDLLLLNVVSPLLAAYTQHIDNPIYIERAIEIIENLKSERNRIIKKWQQIGVNPINGAESQGLIELYNESCASKKCLNCGIGFKILNKT